MQFRDLGRISWSGLTARGQRLVTASILATLLFACGGWTLVSGLLAGSEVVSRRRIEQRPLAFRLLLGDEYTRVARSYIPKMTEHVQAEIAAQKLGDGLRLVSPFQVLPWMVGSHSADAPRPALSDPDGTPDPEDASESGSSSGSGASGKTSLKGRSIQTDLQGNVPSSSGPVLHPLLQGLGFRIDRRKTTKEGVFLCPRLLKLREIPVDQVPDQLDLDLRNGGASVSVPILGVLDRDPPELVYFLCPEPYVFRVERLSQHLAMIRLTPLDPKWVRDANDTAGIERLEKLAMAIPGVAEATVQFSQRRLELRSNADNGCNRTKWEGIAKKLRTIVTKAVGPPENSSALATIFDTDGADGSATDDQAFDQYHLVEMYFIQGRFLPAAVKAVQDDPNLNNRVDRTVAELVTQLQSFSEAKLAILNVIRLTLIFLCLVGLVIIQVMRCAQRSAEAGMLRVMGTRGTDLLAIVSLDAVQVWLMGSLAGAAAGYAIGTVQAARLFPDPHETAWGFLFTAQDFGWLLGVSFGICLLSAWAAVLLTWMRQSPADLVH